jgi:hypothetical protein
VQVKEEHEEAVLLPTVLEADAAPTVYVARRGANGRRSGKEAGAVHLSRAPSKEACLETPPPACARMLRRRGSKRK